MKRATQILSIFAILQGSLPVLGGPESVGESTLFPGQRTAGDLRAAGFRPLFDGKSFEGWDLKPWHQGHFTILDGGVMHYDGQAAGQRGQDNNLWTKESFADFTFYAEWRLPREPEMKEHPIVLYNGDFLMKEDEPRKRLTRLRPDAGDSGFYFRGSPKCQANIWSQELGSGEVNGYRTDKALPPEVRRACIPLRNADRPFGEWNAFEITLKGNRLTVALNGKTVIAAVSLPDLPAAGPIAVQHHGDPVELRMLWVKEFGSQKQATKLKTQKK